MSAEALAANTGSPAPVPPDPPAIVSVNSRGGTSGNMLAKVVFAVLFFGILIIGFLVVMNR